MLRVGIARIDQRESAIDAFANEWRKPREIVAVEITHRFDELALDGWDRLAKPRPIRVGHRGESDDLGRQTERVEARAERDRARQGDARALAVVAKETDVQLAEPAARHGTRDCVDERRELLHLGLIAHDETVEQLDRASFVDRGLSLVDGHAGDAEHVEISREVRRIAQAGGAQMTELIVRAAALRHFLG